MKKAFRAFVRVAILAAIVCVMPFGARAAITAQVTNEGYNAPATGVDFSIFLGSDSGFTGQVILTCADSSANTVSRVVGTPVSTNPGQYYASCTGLSPSTSYSYAVFPSDASSFATVRGSFKMPTASTTQGGETYAIEGAPIVGVFDPNKHTAPVEIKVDINNPVKDLNYYVKVGSPSSDGSSCTINSQLNGTGIDPHYTGGSSQIIVDQNWDIPVGNYCIGIQKEDAPLTGNYITGLALLPGSAFSVSDGTTALGPSSSSTNSPNSNGCLSTATGAYCDIVLLPGVGDSTGKVSLSSCTANGVTTPNGGFGCYVNSIIKLVIGLIGVFSVVMLIVAGVEIMTPGATASEKMTGKARAVNALLGLLVAVGAYVILNTINPNLVNLSITLPSASLSYDSSTVFLPNATASTTTNTGTTLPGICQAYTGNVDCEGHTSQCATYAARINADISDPTMAQFMKANMVEESACDITARSKQTTSGVAVGLFQQLPATAQAYASACNVNVTIDASWLSNPSNVDSIICIQKQFILALQNSCGTNPLDIAAAQDGGPGVCQPSADCTTDTSCVPGNTSVERWECPWDDTAHTLYNTGYEESRNAAKKILYCVNNPGSWAK